MITRAKRLLLACTILGLLASNVLTVTSTAFNAALSGLMSTALRDELYAGLGMW